MGMALVIESDINYPYVMSINLCKLKMNCERGRCSDVSSSTFSRE